MLKSKIKEGWELYNDWQNYCDRPQGDLKYEKLSQLVKKYLMDEAHLSYFGIIEVFSITRFSHNDIKTVFKILKLIGIKIEEDE